MGQDTMATKWSVVKVDVAVIMKARRLAAERGQNLAEYLSDLLRPVVNKEWARSQKKANKELMSEEGGEE